MLASALEHLPRAQRDVAWQDGLDLLAVVAGMKPLCLVGRGFADAEWRMALLRTAARAALPVLEAAPWQPAAEPAVLQDWYVEALRQRETAPLSYICADATIARRAAALSAQGRVSAADEAALLGYPPCCVAQHHRQAIGLERLTIAMTERLAGSERARMVRLVAAGVAPLPATEAEWRRYESLTAIAPSPGTSVNMCTACAADREGAAAALARRYAALAAAACYPART